MFFNVSGHEVKAEVEKKETFLSKHSENKLEKLKIHFQVYNPLKIPKKIISIDDGKKWKVVDSYHYYTEGNPVVRYIFHIEEMEELEISSLYLQELQIKPEYYHEEVEESRDVLSIKAQLNLDEKQWHYLTDLYKKGFLEVKREGISTKRKKMRFDKLIWSKGVDKQIKCALSLIQDKFDSYRLPSTFIAEIENLKKLSSSNLKSMELLGDILLEKKIINKQELERIIKILDEEYDGLQYLEVADLDDFLKKYEF